MVGLFPSTEQVLSGAYFSVHLLLFGDIPQNCIRQLYVYTYESNKLFQPFRIIRKIMLQIWIFNFGGGLCGGGSPSEKNRKIWFQILNYKSLTFGHQKSL